jgi:hypothetical protein
VRDWHLARLREYSTRAQIPMADLLRSYLQYLVNRSSEEEDVAGYHPNSPMLRLTKHLALGAGVNGLAAEIGPEGAQHALTETMTAAGFNPENINQITEGTAYKLPSGRQGTALALKDVRPIQPQRQAESPYPGSGSPNPPHASRYPSSNRYKLACR